MAKVNVETVEDDRGELLAKAAEARKLKHAEQAGDVAGLAAALFAIPSGPGGMYAAYKTGKAVGGGVYDISQNEAGRGMQRMASGVSPEKYLPKSWSGWFDDDEDEGRINTDGNREE